MVSETNCEYEEKKSTECEKEKIKTEEVEWECAAVWERSTLFDR